MARPNQIRVISLGAVKGNDGKYLFFKGYDKVKDEYFYRAVGGGVDFLEKATNAVKREFMEEIKAEIEVFDCLGFFENIFNFNGKDYHEYVMIYDVEFLDKSLYNVETIAGNEDNGESFTCEWIDLKTVKENIYPQGIKDIILGRGKR